MINAIITTKGVNETEADFVPLKKMVKRLEILERSMRERVSSDTECFPHRHN